MTGGNGRTSAEEEDVMRVDGKGEEGKAGGTRVRITLNRGELIRGGRLEGAGKEREGDAGERGEGGGNSRWEETFEGKH